MPRTLVLALVVLESLGIVACFGGVTSLGGEYPQDYGELPDADEPWENDAAADFEAGEYDVVDAGRIDASRFEAGRFVDASATVDGGEIEGG